MPQAARNPLAPALRQALRPLGTLAAQRGALFVWVPVCLGIGIGLYFALPVEPGGTVLAVLTTLAVGLFALGGRGPERWQPVAIAGGVVATGLVLAALRAVAVAAPVLPFRYYGPVEGRVVLVDRAASGNPRVTLDRVRLARLAPEETPARVRLTLTGPQPGAGAEDRPRDARAGRDAKEGTGLRVPLSGSPSGRASGRTAGDAAAGGEAPGGAGAMRAVTESAVTESALTGRAVLASGQSVTPGMRVMTTAFLGPPQGPAEPGGFDFQRHAWFAKLGAVGYTRVPLLRAGPGPEGRDLFFARLRQRIADGVRARLPGDPGGFVSAILTNDKSGLSRGALSDLRLANLAHMLAISGLHMALVTGFVFGLLRYGLALLPWVALRLNTKKIAALLALAGAFFYLMLSGAAVATERSFVMVSVMLVAVLLDRRAISLRSVAISALIVLALTPEALISAGFQMSYAATVALVAVFEALRRRGAAGRGGWPPPRWAAPAVMLALSSLVAGLATAPFGAAYFGRLPAYGLLANLLAMPVMAMLEMPGAVLAGLLAPLGLEGPVLWIVGQGARWILGVAHLVAGLEGAARPVPAPPGAALPLLALGGLWLVLWQGRARFAGLAAMAAALALWAGAQRPLLLVADSGGLIGVLGQEGRVLSKPVSGFVAHAWLQSDGDPADMERAAARAGAYGPAGMRWFDLEGLSVAVLTGRGAERSLAEACALADLVVTDAPGRPAPPGCRLIGRDLLARTGALAFRRRGAALVPVAARAVQGDRPWVTAGHRGSFDVPALAPLKLPGALADQVAARQGTAEGRK